MLYYAKQWGGFVALGFLLLATPWAALAEDGKNSPQTDKETHYQLDTVTVTVEKREQNSQDVPASLSVLSETAIEDAGLTSVEEAVSYMPNIHFIDFGAAFEQRIFMRGLGSTHNAPAVNFNIDGVTQFRSESLDMALYDIESIEVLRGPQGTLYGRNSLGGVINITTRKPDNELRGQIRTDFGNYNLQQYQGAVSGPVIKDSLYLGLAGSYKVRDGFTKNDFLDNDVDNMESVDGRVHLRLAPADSNFEANLKLYAEGDRHGTSALQLLDDVKDTPHTANFDHVSDTHRQVLGSSLSLEWKLDDGVFTSISAFQKLNLWSDSDFDFSTADMNTFTNDSESYQYSQELRYSAGTDKDIFRWTTGVYAWGSQQEDISSTTDGKDMPPMFGFPGNANHNKADLEGYGFAPFGQATVTVFDKLDLTAGIRWEWEKRDGDFHDYTERADTGTTVENLKGSDSIISQQWLPKFSAAYHFTDNLMAYASLAWGYRSGGFNFMYDPNNPESVSFDPETSINYEVGVKSTWLDNRLYANLSAYYIEIEDMQVSVGIPGKMTMLVDNAGEAHSRGAELEVGVRPFTGMDINASYGYTEMEYDKYTDPVKNVDYSGKTPPYVPNHTYSLSAQYRYPLTDTLTLFTRGEVIGVGKQYWGSDNAVSEDPYQLLNARIGVESEDFDVYLYGKNLTDQEYRKIGYLTGMGAVYAQSGDPLTFGVNLVYRF